MLAALLGAAACYAKQTAAPCVIGVLLYLAVSDRRRLCLYGAYAAVFCGVPFVILQCVTGGGFLQCIWTLTRGMTVPGLRHWLAHVGLFGVGMLPVIALR